MLNICILTYQHTYYIKILKRFPGAHISEMGCITSKDMDVVNPTQFKKMQKLGDEMFVPQSSNLYNLLRKRSDIQIIRNNQSKESLFFGQSVIDLDNLKLNELKLMCSFKNIICIGFEKDTLETFKKNFAPKAMYILTTSQAQHFLKQFPIFSHSSPKIQAKRLPILAIYQEEISNAHKKRMIFVHSKKFENSSIYSQLHIKQIITEEGSNGIVQRLRQANSDKILFLHSSQTTPENLLDILCQLLKEEYNINEKHSKVYLANILPQTKLTQLQHVGKSQSLLPISAGIQGQERTMSERLTSTLLKLFQENGQDKPKLDRSYNLITNLLSNIYNNKQADNFRKVKKTNKQINDLLGRYKSGVKLLEEVGFVDENGFFVNNTDLKYLKLYRVDLDLAFKKTLQKIAS